MKLAGGVVILTNKNHVLEEASLPEFKKGIINILNGEEPVDIPKNIPIVQIVMSILIFALFITAIMLIIKYKRNKICKKMTWLFLGSLFLILSITLIPLLIYSTNSPWQTIKTFSADVALLISIIVTLLNVNGLISIYIALKSELVNKS